MFLRNLLSIIVLLSLFTMVILNCSNEQCLESKLGYSNCEFDQYEVNSNFKTSEGILYDPSGLSISPDLIDRLTNEVNVCLYELYDNKLLSEDIITNSFCTNLSINKTIPLPIDKSSFIVKIANDWVISCDGLQQLLPTPIKYGGSSCISKGLIPTAECPCRWRAGFKCPNVIITTPSFYLFKDVLIRFVTGCQGPWETVELSKCASPTTTPLSDGSDPKNGILK